MSVAPCYRRIFLIKYLQTKNLFSLEHSLASNFLSSFEYPWQALSSLKDYLAALGISLDESEFIRLGDGIWAHKSAKIAPSAYIAAPCIIDENAELRHCAYVRGSAIIGKGCVIGNSTEVKNSVLFDGALAPHFNYVGDSILGYKSHFGAGVIASNVKSDKSPVTVRCGGESISTGLKKLGAIVGDFAEIGCNSVLNPGTVIGAYSAVYPLSVVRGSVPPNSIYKRADNVCLRRGG